MCRSFHNDNSEEVGKGSVIVPMSGSTEDFLSTDMSWIELLPPV